MLAQTPVQIAWVTRDLDATERSLTSLLGARKWVRMPGVHFGPDTCTYRGEPADFVADISLSYAGATQLELIAPGAGASVYTEFLERCGPGLHHVCVEVDDVDAALSGRDADVVARGVMPGGMEFAYVSAPQAGVPYIELAYIPDEIRSFFDHIKREQQ
ncbi:VOC family protein [Mycolicibacterium flavescens]|uniref:Lactoylglutathione lyase n=1 Tax=Mycolicibacterium flavescens TaxID=1776 RepID=A0A1E3RA99_MYCFV|nr:VOC family protein [Mycolicibacterium flavescens]MCV7279112.1 VOC family protein [Mycolicibacterium flavescens]ODQ86754.1 lactoylglutathione lyase [Mycolicibacterium flavescens]